MASIPQRPDGMSEWRTRADYTTVSMGWLELIADAKGFLAEWSVHRFRRTCSSERVADAAGMIARLCYRRQVIPVRCGSRVHVPGRLISGCAVDNQHEGGWLAVCGPISFAMGVDQEGTGDGRSVAETMRAIAYPGLVDHALLVKTLDPMCIHAKTEEPFALGWMEPDALEAVAVSVDAAMAGVSNG